MEYRDWRKQLDHLCEEAGYKHAHDLDRKVGKNDWQAMFLTGKTPIEALAYVLNPLPDPDWRTFEKEH